MEVKAILRHLRMAPRKVRLIVDAVRGLSVAEAETRLQFIHRDASRPVLKLIQSATANAEHNFKLDRANLFIKTITADAGTTLKRFRPRAMGRAAPIRKRTTHISIVLSDDPKPVKEKKTTRPVGKGVKARAAKAAQAKKTEVAPQATPAAQETNA